MNKFRFLLENDLTEKKEKEKTTTKSFDVSLPVSDYKEYADTNDLMLAYAKRDTTGAIKKAKETIKKSAKSVPLNLEFKAKYKTMKKGKVIFAINVTGNSIFLGKLNIWKK